MNKITKRWWCWVITMGVVMLLGFLASPAKGEEQISLGMLRGEEPLLSLVYDTALKLPIEERNRIFIGMANAVYEKYKENSRNIYAQLYITALEDIKDPKLKSYRYWRLGCELIYKFGDKIRASGFYHTALNVGISIGDLQSRSNRQMQICCSLADIGLFSDASVYADNFIEDDEIKAFTLLYVWKAWNELD